MNVYKLILNGILSDARYLRITKVSEYPYKHSEIIFIHGNDNIVNTLVLFLSSKAKLYDKIDFWNCNGSIIIRLYDLNDELNTGVLVSIDQEIDDVARKFFN